MYLNLRDRRDRPDQPDTWRKVNRPCKTCSECGYALSICAMGFVLKTFTNPNYFFNGCTMY